MLVISRKPGERVHIGDEIQVAILEISGSRVVIGIAAPREIAIRRVGLMDSVEPKPSARPEAFEEDPPQPEIELEYRHMDAADLAQASESRSPVVRVKRSRLKGVLPETVDDPLAAAG
ncbi:MAG: carbon storage regulator [Pseudomonadota bacterium]